MNAPASPWSLPPRCCDPQRNPSPAITTQTGAGLPTNASLEALTNSIQQLMIAEFTRHCDTLSKKQDAFLEELRSTNAHLLEDLAGSKATLAGSELKQQKAIVARPEIAFAQVGSLNENKPEAKRNHRHSGRATPGGKQPVPDITGSQSMSGSGSFQSQQERETNQKLVKMVSRNLEEIASIEQAEKPSCHRRISNFLALDVRGKIIRIDVIMGVLITTNAVTIGLSMDNEGAFWDGVDMCFSVLFLAEFILKISLLGLPGYFYAQGAMANWFDTLLVGADWIQIALRSFNGTENEAPSTSWLRLARLFRLVRLARLMRLEVFQPLVAMIAGLAGAASTLLWSIALFFMITYVVALMFRESFGRESKDQISMYFDNVPRSMFTVFRCSFGDCSSKDGQPIFEHITLEYGGLFSLVYCLFTFVIVVGLFNVISAIFVESTMAAAIENKLARKQERLMNPAIWQNSVSVMMVAFLEHTGRTSMHGGIEDQISDLVEGEITIDVFHTWITDVKVTKALNDLDINPDDHQFLFDIFDCDNAGGLSMSEMVDGLARLRGEPRRSDIITIDLMARSMQTQIHELVAKMDSVIGHLGMAGAEV